ADFLGPDGWIVFCGDRSIRGGYAQARTSAGGLGGACSMRTRRELLLVASICGCVLVSCVVSCRAKPSGEASASVGEESRKRAGSDRASAQQTSDDAPPAEKTGGFDGKRAFAHVAKQVSFGPRPSGSPALAQ